MNSAFAIYVAVMFLLTALVVIVWALTVRAVFKTPGRQHDQPGAGVPAAGPSGG